MDIQDLKPYLDTGFWMEYSDRRQILKDLNPNPDKGNGVFKEGIVCINLDSEITPNICEICQMNKAEKEWVKDYVLTMDICNKCKESISLISWPPPSESLCERDRASLEKWFDEKIEEHLCNSCFDIRVYLKESRLNKLENWSEKEENPKVAWIKINLDISGLIRSLELLYAKYLKDIGVPDPKNKVEIRFSVLGEFHKDYEGFLVSFEKDLRDMFREDMEVPILEDFFVIRIDALSRVIDILRIYYNLFKKYFPQFETLNGSPLKISISCSHAKFPFFEHWEILQKPKSDVYITLLDKGEVKANIKNMKEILIRASHTTSKASIGALHKLADIAKLSENLAEVALQDKSDKNYMTYGEILPMGLDFNSLLTFAKIMVDQYEIS